MSLQVIMKDGYFYNFVNIDIFSLATAERLIDRVLGLKVYGNPRFIRLPVRRGTFSTFYSLQRVEEPDRPEMVDIKTAVFERMDILPKDLFKGISFI